MRRSRNVLASGALFPLSVHSSPPRVSPSVKLPFSREGTHEGGADRHFLAPAGQHRCPQENSTAYLVDNATKTPRYLAKVVACMAGQIHRLRETGDTFFPARRLGRRNRVFVSRSRQWNHIYLLREGMDGSAKAVPSRIADARGATRVGRTDSRIWRALSGARRCRNSEQRFR